MQYEYNRLKKFVATAVIALLFTTVLVSCKTKFDHPDKQIFHYNESSGILSLDPAFASGQATIWPWTGPLPRKALSRTRLLSKKRKTARW